MPSRTMLVIGSYSESLKTLLPVLHRLVALRGVEPLACIDADTGTWNAAAAVVRAGGFRVFEEPVKDDLDGKRIYEPFSRARAYRRRNRALAGAILDRVQPEAILCTRDTAHGEFVRTAAERGVPSLYVQWTEIHSPEFHRRLREAEVRFEDAQRPFGRRLAQRVKRMVDGLASSNSEWPLHIPATRLAVQGPFTRDMCLAAGVGADRVLVTGSPQCDEMHRCASLGPAALHEIRRAVGAVANRPFLLYAHEHTDRLSHLTPASAALAEAQVLHSMRVALPQYERVVKLHPRAGADTRARLRALDPDAFIVATEAPIGELVAASALVVSMTSSTMLWAVGIDRPAVSAFFWQGVDEQRLTRHWTGVELADTPEELVRAIGANVMSPEHRAVWSARRAGCRQDFLRVDGEAVERIARAYANLVDHGSGAPHPRFGSPRPRAGLAQ